MRKLSLIKLNLKDTNMVDSGGDLFIYELKVGMTCEACSNAIKRIFEKVPDITEVDCDDWASEKVIVKGKDGLDLVAML